MTQSYDESLNPNWFLEAGIMDLQRAMENREITSVWLVRQFLARIAAFNHQAPNINAILEVNPDALFIAEGLDLERLEAGPRSPLHGIPLLLKDNLNTGDKLHTSAGSIALENSLAEMDAFVVKQLRKAGAIILGKANMTEWANFMTEGMPNGFSSRGGQVLNPYGPGRFDTGGSSSGSAAGVAAGFAVGAIGTETSGSILSPASANSLVGIKPTVGLVSRSGIVPIAYSQDTAGPIAKTVSDAAVILGAMTGLDEMDEATRTSRGRSHRDYTEFLDNRSLNGARIGVPHGAFVDGLSSGQRAVLRRGMQELEQAGAQVIELPSGFEGYDEENIDVLIYEFKSAINAYLANLSSEVPVHSLADVIAFNLRHAKKALKYEQTILVESQRTTGTLAEPRYLESRLKDIESSRDEGIDRVMKQYDLSALLFVNNYGAGIAAKAGYPSVTVPAGYTDDGEPVGLTFTGLAYSEPDLVGLAYAYEQSTGHRVNPHLS